MGASIFDFLRDAGVMQEKTPPNSSWTTSWTPSQSRKPALSFIFLTVFIYLLGFGIIIPLIPLLSRDYGATAFESGLLMSCYSLMQFIFAPFWGRLSDRYGRRPILLFCLFAEVFCYLLFAFSNSLILLFVARSLSGFFGASLSTASAYISDITSKAERSKGMALIGVAFGLGFMIGPALGGGLSQAGEWISLQSWALTHNENISYFVSKLPITLPSLFVSFLCLVNFFIGLKFLAESKGYLAGEVHHQQKSRRLLMVWSSLKQKTLGTVLLIFFIASFAMSSMEATFILFMRDKFLWTVKEISYGFAYIGLIMVLTQGFFARRMLPRFGEKKVMTLGFTFLTLGFFIIGLSETLFSMALAVTLMSFGSALINPAALGSISLLSPAEEQGHTMGVTQSLSSLGRILGPALGGYLYYLLSNSKEASYSSAPFIFSGFLGLVGLFMIFMTYSGLPESARVTRNPSKK
jgi:MFS family permease